MAEKAWDRDPNGLPLIGKKPNFDGFGTGGDDGGMEARLAKLESDVSHLNEGLVDLRAQTRGLSAIATDMAVKVGVIEERTKHVATKAWVLSGVIVVLLAIVGSCWWVAQQYLAPILAAAGR